MLQDRKFDREDREIWAAPTWDFELVAYIVSLALIAALIAGADEVAGIAATLAIICWGGVAWRRIARRGLRDRP